MIDAKLTKPLISILFLFPGMSLGRSVSLSAEDVFDAYTNATKQSLLYREKLAYKSEGTLITKLPERYKLPKDVRVFEWSVFRDGVRLHSRQKSTTFEDDQIDILNHKRECLLGDEHCFTFTHGVAPWVHAYTKNRLGKAFGSLSPLDKASAGYIPELTMKPLWEVMEGTSAVLKLRENVEVIDGHETYVLEIETPNLGHYTLWIDYNCGYNLRRYVVRRTGSDLLKGKPLSTPPRPRAPGSPRIYSFARSELTNTLDSVKIENIGGLFVPVEGRVVSHHIHTNGEERTRTWTLKRSEFDLNPDFDNYEKAFDTGIPDGTRVVSVDHGFGIPYIWVDGKMVADVDDLVIAELDKTAQQIMADGDVPPKLGSFKKTDANDLEPNKVTDTNAEAAESQPELLAESNGPPVVALILIGLVIAGVVGLIVFRKLKA